MNRPEPRKATQPTGNRPDTSNPFENSALTQLIDTPNKLDKHAATLIKHVRDFAETLRDPKKYEVSRGYAIGPRLERLDTPEYVLSAREDNHLVFYKVGDELQKALVDCIQSELDTRGFGKEVRIAIAGHGMAEIYDSSKPFYNNDMFKFAFSPAEGADPKTFFERFENDPNGLAAMSAIFEKICTSAQTLYDKKGVKPEGKK